MRRIDSEDEFEKRAKRYLHKRSSSKYVWVVAIVAIVALFTFMGLLRGSFDQILQHTETQDRTSPNFTLENIPSIMAGSNAVEKKEITKMICVFDQFSNKGIKNVRIFLNDRGVGRTTQFGCSDINLPNDGKNQVIRIEGRSLLEPFNSARIVPPETSNTTIEFYVDLYDNADLNEIAYSMIDEYRTANKLPVFKHSNDVNTQKWAEYLHKNMLTENGMMENVQAQIVHTNGYIKKLNDVACTKKVVDCPPTYYTYSCKDPGCTIERGETVEKIIMSMLQNDFFQSKAFSYISVGISYDEHVMFIVVNFG